VHWSARVGLWVLAGAVGSRARAMASGPWRTAVLAAAEAGSLPGLRDDHGPAGGLEPAEAAGHGRSHRRRAVGPRARRGTARSRNGSESPRARSGGGCAEPAASPSSSAPWRLSSLTTSILSSPRSTRPAPRSVTRSRPSAPAQPRSGDVSAATGRRGRRSSRSRTAGFSLPAGRDRAYFGPPFTELTPSSMNTKPNPRSSPSLSPSSPSSVTGNTGRHRDDPGGCTGPEPLPRRRARPSPEQHNGDLGRGDGYPMGYSAGRPRQGLPWLPSP